MPQQLIYTSSPRGLIAGRSGFCTVARSESMRDALALRLEQLSYYEHQVLTGGSERRICTSRIVDLRGSKYFVLSRLQDAGLDFTNRTNFLAHHVAFSADELSALPLAPVIFQQWDGWCQAWTREPGMLSAENWGNLYALAGKPLLPARTWAAVTGDAINAIGLADAPGAVYLLADDLNEDQLLSLFAESMETLEARSETGDFLTRAWQISFTTCLQEQDTTADFRWRSVVKDTPVFRKLSAAGIPLISARTIRTGRHSLAQAELARSGRQPLTIVVQPQDVQGSEGEVVELRVEAKSVPPPNRYEWFQCSKDGTPEHLLGEGGPVLELANAQVGVSRYAVRISNARGESCFSRVVQVSLERKARLKGPSAASSNVIRVQLPTSTAPKSPSEPPKAWTADAEELAVHLQKTRLEQAERRRRTILLLTVIWLLLMILLAAIWWIRAEDYSKSLEQRKDNAQEIDKLLSDIEKQPFRFDLYPTLKHKIESLHGKKQSDQQLLENELSQSEKNLSTFKQQPLDIFASTPTNAESFQKTLLGIIRDSHTKNISIKALPAVQADWRKILEDKLRLACEEKQLKNATFIRELLKKWDEHIESTSAAFTSSTLFIDESKAALVRFDAEAKKLQTSTNQVDFNTLKELFAKLPADETNSRYAVLTNFETRLKQPAPGKTKAVPPKPDVDLGKLPSKSATTERSSQ